MVNKFSPHLLTMLPAMFTLHPSISSLTTARLPLHASSSSPPHALSRADDGFTAPFCRHEAIFAKSEGLIPTHAKSMACNSLQPSIEFGLEEGSDCGSESPFLQEVSKGQEFFEGSISDGNDAFEDCALQVNELDNLLQRAALANAPSTDRKSTRLNSSHWW